MINIWNKDEIANQIDEVWESKVEQNHRNHVADIINQHMIEDGILLDAGCGSGEVYKHIRHYLKEKNVRYMGIDGSVPFIEKCRERYKADFQLLDHEHWIQREMVRFELQNLFGTVFSDKMFDMTICIDVIQHVGYYEAILKEIFRITRKKMLIRTWVHDESDQIVFNDDVNNNIYNEQMLISYCQLISAGRCEKIETGLYLLSK
jgi:ubiquinone/menaquinone biosynthesis C-methylase UbiE